MRNEQEEQPKIGCELPYVNVLADTLQWRVERRWRWRKPAHINLLEQRAVHEIRGRGLPCIPFEGPSRLDQFGAEDGHHRGDSMIMGRVDHQ